MKKQREGEEEEKVWREEFVYSLLQPDALKRLNQTEQENSAKVLTLPRHVRGYSPVTLALARHPPSRPTVQADEVKARLFTMANKGTKGLDTPFSDAGKRVNKGSITDDDMKRLIEGTDQARQHGLQPLIHRGAVSLA